MESLIKKIKFLLRYVALTKFGLVVEKDMQYLGRKRDRRLLPGDYIRKCALELVAFEICHRKIEGSVAELGVYKGDFAALINELFPDRKLYLFDTFEGFNEKDIIIERETSFSDASQDFSNTSIEEIIRKMKYKENVIIKKGYFPDTALDIEDKFCFVSIDVDLYQPTKKGLEFFYNKLVKGGYIFVHDFNNSGYKGVRQAVYEFSEKYGVNFVPLPDICGTAIIVK